MKFIIHLNGQKTKAFKPTMVVPSLLGFQELWPEIQWLDLEIFHTQGDVQNV